MTRTTPFLPLLFLAAGCTNTPPTVPGVEIVPTAPYTTDDLEASLAAQAHDEDGDNIIYRYAWFQDDSERTDIGNVALVGAANTAKGQVWRVVVTPSDGADEGTPAEATATVLNTPPVAQAIITPAEPFATEDLTVVAEASDEDDDPVSFGYRWLLDGEPTTYTDATLPAEATTRGDQWTVELTPNDGADDGQPVDATVNIENTVPVLTAVSIGPNPAYEADTIEASAEVEDADGDELALTYAWSVDGIVVQQGELATLTGELFDKHQQLQVTVTPDDGWVDGAAMGSDTLTISNSPPAITEVTLDPEELLEGSTVRCVPAGWSDDDGDPESHGYSWQIGGLDVGVGDDTLDGANFDRGDTITCTVTPNDGEEDGAPVTSATATVGNSPPVITNAALSSTSPGTDDTLSVTVTASDGDGDAITHAYAWYVDGSLTAATATLSSSAFSRGQTVWVDVTPNDGLEDGATVSSDVATVVNTSPAVTTASLSPTAVYTDDTLTANASTTDADGDSVSLSYDWYVDGVLTASGSSSLDGTSHFDKGQQVYVVVTPDDGDGEGVSLASDTVEILNTPPTVPAVAISPAAPREDEDLLCQITTASTDADADSVDYGFVWSVDGASYASASTTSWPGDTVPASDTASGELWTCTVTPTDGDDEGDTVSDTVQVGVLFSGWPSTTNSVSDADYAFYGDAASDTAGGQSLGGGDIDGDGLNDVLIGAQGADDAGADAGQASIFLGANLGATTTLPLDDGDYVLYGETAGDYAGTVVAMIGDVDGDGLEDVGVGAGSSDAGGSSSGATYVVLASSLPSGGSASLSSSDWRIHGESSGDALVQIAAAGDMDGDGYDDILTSCRYNDDGGTDAGKSYLFYASSLGSTRAISAGTADVQLVGEDAGDSSGRFVRGDGDIDGDGIPDVAISAWYADDGGSRAGKAYVFLGASLPSSGTVDLSAADYSFIGEASTNYLSHSIHLDGDVDGDGLNDLLFSAYFNDDGGTYAGKVYLFTGATLASKSGTIDPATADYAWLGDSAQDQAGTGCAFGGDIDADGLDDVVIGAKLDDAGTTDAGTQYLFLGANLGSGGTASVATADYLFVGNESSAQCGWDVVRWGDVNGDGLDDLMNACPYADGGGSNSGVVYLTMAP